MREVEEGKIHAMRFIVKSPTVAILLVLLLLFPGALSLLAATTRLPRFTDFPVRSVYRGKTHALLSEYKDAHPKTGIPDAAQRKADFAGHYIMIHAGCGAGCSALSVMDAKTGEIYEFTSLGLDDWNDLHYRITSRLLVFQGTLDDNASHGTYYYVFKANHFVRLRYIHSRRE